MKGFSVTALGAVAFIMVAGLLLFYYGWMEPGAIAGACQNIYGYFPSFRCCDEMIDYQGLKTLTYQNLVRDGNQLYHCPDTMHRCEVILSDADFTAGTKVYTGTQGCGWAGIFGETWSCTDDAEVPMGSWVSVPSGAWVHLVGPASVNIDYRHYRLKLCECGSSGCGVPCLSVLGADGCGFNTNMEIYDSQGRIKIGADPLSQFAYTVPFGECYTYFPDTNRRVIGDTCEDCESTNDCASRYPITYPYLGKTYGAICGSGSVQLYDCLATGGEVCVKWRKDTSGSNVECLEYGQASRCDLYRSIPVQCCPGDSSCGANAFCGSDYTCRQTAECETDPDCGHNVMCDYTTTTLKTPICQGGQCTFDQQDVQCCLDANCPAGYYCAADYSCKEKTATEEICPWECCDDDAGFIDRPCAAGKFCCPDHTCQAVCGTGTDDSGVLWLIIPILIASFASIGYLLGGKLGAGIAGIIGGLVGYLLYWWFSLPAWNQWLLVLLGGAGIFGLFYIFIALGGVGIVVAYLAGRN